MVSKKDAFGNISKVLGRRVEAPLTVEVFMDYVRTASSDDSFSPCSYVWKETADSYPEKFKPWCKDGQPCDITEGKRRGEITTPDVVFPPEFSRSSPPSPCRIGKIVPDGDSPYVEHEKGGVGVSWNRISFEISAGNSLNPKCQAACGGPGLVVKATLFMSIGGKGTPTVRWTPPHPPGAVPN
jgi:hypothetical protein